MLFGKFLTGAKKVQNANVLEAIIAASLLVSASDGEIEKEETEKLEKLLQHNDLLSAFKPAEINKVVSKYTGILEADFNVGKLKLMKEIRDVSSNVEHAEEVFVTALAIANSDGEVEPAEQKVLVDIAKTLSINPTNYGL